MKSYKWTVAMSVLALTARVLQLLQGGCVNFVQPVYPPSLPLHARIQTRKTNQNGPQPFVQPPRFGRSALQRSSRTACRFAWLLDLPLVAEAAEVTIQGVSFAASATEEVLGLGAVSAELLGGGVSCAIEVFDVKFLASLPEAPAFLVGAVEADWLAAIGANVISKVETSALADFAVAKLEASEAAGMVALSEEKQIEFACGILSRVSPSQLADLIKALIGKVIENPSLLGKIPPASMEVAISIFQKSPQAMQVLIELLKRFAGEAMPTAAAAGLAQFAIEALSVEQVLELLSAAPFLLPEIINAAVAFLPQEQLLEWGGVLASKASADLLQQIISTILTVLPAEKLLELSEVFISQASPELLGKVILTAADVWPVEKLLEMGSGLLQLSEDLLQPIISTTLTVLPKQKLLEMGEVFISQASPELLGKVILTAANVWPVEKLFEMGRGLVSQLPKEDLVKLFYKIQQSAPEEFEMLSRLSPEAAREAAESFIGKEFPSQSKLALAPLEFGEYEQVMAADAALSAFNQTVVQGNVTRKFPQEVVGVGKVVVGLGASLGVKQVAVLIGVGQGPILLLLGFGASWKAKELYQEMVE